MPIRTYTMHITIISTRMRTAHALPAAMPTITPVESSSDACGGGGGEGGWELAVASVRLLATFSWTCATSAAGGDDGAATDGEAVAVHAQLHPLANQMPPEPPPPTQSASAMVQSHSCTRWTTVATTTGHVHDAEQREQHDALHSIVRCPMRGSDSGGRKQKPTECRDQ